MQLKPNRKHVRLVGTLHAVLLIAMAQPLAALAQAQPSTGTNGASLSATAQQYQQQCTTAGGYFQYGTVNAPPNSDYSKVTNYKSGAKRKGVPLTHTHIEITSALDGNVYDVAIDNVFANDYSKTAKAVPRSYAQAITANSNIYLCSGNPSKVPYSETENLAHQGFDWVHTNCASSGYSSTFQNGFIYTDAGVNLTNSQKYCYLWP